MRLSALLGASTCGFDENIFHFITRILAARRHIYFPLVVSAVFYMVPTASVNKAIQAASATHGGEHNSCVDFTAHIRTT